MTLGSAVSGFQDFPAALDGHIIEYSIEHQTSSEAEAGFGVYTESGTTLSRVYRTYPTLGGSAVNFSAGTKHVRLTATVLRLATNEDTTDPTADDGIDSGYLRGRSYWLNTSTDELFVCVDHGTGASPGDAVWISVQGAVSSVNGATGAVTLDALDIDISALVPSNYTPAGASIEEHLEGIDDALTGGADAAPSQSVSDAAAYVLSVAEGMHANVEVLSHQASVDFEVPTNATPGLKWLIKPIHDGCTISVDSDAGTINGTAGGSVRAINGGVAIVEVTSLTGSPSEPVVLVRGNVIVPPTDVAGTKTYDNDDADGRYRLTSTATQTFGATSGYSAGFEVILLRETAGTITVAGVDANYTISGPDIVIVTKVGTALLATGKAEGSPIILDAS
jgi:hypothetical protein